MYEIGGIYLDIDSMIYNNISMLIKNNNAVISREKNPGFFVQWCMMFIPKHFIIEKTLNLCIESILSKKSNDIIDVTGPGIYTKTINTFYGTDAWYKTDIDLTKNYKNTIFNNFDYMGYCKFKHPQAHLLYENKPHWNKTDKLYK